MRFSKKNGNVVCQTAGLKFQAIEENKSTYPVTLMCKMLGVTPGGYYKWRKRPESSRSKDNRRVVELIEKIHLGSRKTYGSPRVYSVLTGMGEACSKSRVERLMRDNNIRAKTKKKFRVTTDSNHKLPVAENILDRDFKVGSTQTALAGDITYIWTNEGWLYLSVVMQLSTRKIVGWAMAETMDRSLVINSLKMAMRSVYVGSTTLFHSDRGSQYASEDHRAVLEIFGLDQSMSRRANCWDNSVIESFFGTLKREHVHFENFETRSEAISSIFEWIECFYNRRRIHSSFGYVTPEEYETRLLAA